MGMGFWTIFLTHLSTSTDNFMRYIWQKTDNDLTFQGHGLGTFFLSFVQHVSKFIEKQHIGISPSPDNDRSPVIYLQVNIKEITYSFYTILCFMDMRPPNADEAVMFLSHVWHGDMKNKPMEVGFTDDDDLTMMCSTCYVSEV